MLYDGLKREKVSNLRKFTFDSNSACTRTRILLDRLVPGKIQPQRDKVIQLEYSYFEANDRLIAIFSIKLAIRNVITYKKKIIVIIV